MALPSVIIRRSTRALQPAATAVAAGTLYFVTDESVLERSSGSAWESYSGGAGVSDGDKGDITVSSSGAAWAVDANAITFAKMQDIATDRLIGRDTGSSGDPEEIALSTGLEWSGSQSIRMTTAQRTRQIMVVIGDGVNTVTTGIKGYVTIPVACTITKATLLANATGSIVIDLWKDSYANFPPVDADSITASAQPTLSSAQKSQDSTLTGWTTALAAGDVLAVNVDSVATVTQVTLALDVTVT